MLAIVSLAILGLAAPVLSQVADCDGNRYPDYEWCDEIVKDWEDNWDYVNNDCQDVCILIYGAGSGNCVIASCFETTECVGQAFSTMYSLYEHNIKSWCEPQNAGGQTRPSNGIFASAYNDPDWIPGGQLNSLQAFNAKTKTMDNGQKQVRMSVEEFREWSNVTSEQPMEARHVTKRQDDEWNSLLTFRNVARDGYREQASGRLSSGVTQTWSFTETISFTTSTSAEMGVSLWEIFSASMSVETSETHSEAAQSGLSFTSGDCPDQGIVYFVPLWNQYVGYWSSDPDTEITVWIPQALGDFVDGSFETECLG